MRKNSEPSFGEGIVIVLGMIFGGSVLAMGIVYLAINVLLAL